MALNSSGPISLAGTTAGQSIEIENGGNGTTQISLNDAAVRTLAGVPSGAITMPTNFWGKSNVVNISYTFSTNTADAALNLSTLPGYSAGKTNFTVTINSGVYLYATSTGSYGLNISGGTTGDTLTIVNNGYIAGKGGKGGTGPDTGSGGTAGQNGGPALNLGFGMSSCTINNTNASAYIGGGGGGGCVPVVYGLNFGGGGGGAGGGDGGVSYTGSGAIGTGGGPGSSGNPGTGPYGPAAGGGAGGASNGWSYSKSGPPTGGGGGGGRIFPGVGGSAVNADTSSGGSANNVGGRSNGPAGGGGGWGAAGGTYNNQTVAGTGGKAVNTNGKSITWTSGDTTRVWGSVA